MVSLLAYRPICQPDTKDYLQTPPTPPPKYFTSPQRQLCAILQSQTRCFLLANPSHKVSISLGLLTGALRYRQWVCMRTLH